MSAAAGLSDLSAFEIPLRPCEPWCEVGDGHGNDHPHDRDCWSTYHPLVLTHRRHRPQKYTDGRYLQPWLNVYLRREFDEPDGVLVIHSEETDRELYLTRAQALDLRDIIDGLVDQLET